MTQGVKEPALSLLQFGLLLWCKFNPWPWNFQPHATGMAGKKKKRKKIYSRIVYLVEKYVFWGFPGGLVVNKSD